LGADFFMSVRLRHRIVILGGGFGGLYTALKLEGALSHLPYVEVTLVNRENFFLFTPLLHEVAASDVDITHIVNPIRKLLHRVNFFHGEVRRIDLPSRRIHVVHGPEFHPHEMEYDYLVIALGGTTNFYGIPGLQEHALTMKSLGDAIHLRNRLIDLLEEADSECAVGMRKNLLTVAVAGGGFAGVETVAAVNDFLRQATRSYHHLSKDLIRTVLIHAGPLILPELGDALGAYAQSELAKRKVAVCTSTKVRGMSTKGLELSDGSTLSAATVVWTAGTSPSPILEALPCEKQTGRLVVNEFMEVPGWDGVWALGDCALLMDPRTGKPYPATAQHAMREGKTVAKNILAAIRGGTKKPFEYSTIGLLAATGRRTGVANILGLNFSGFIAWFLWRTIYLSKLPRLEKKLRVALDWALDLLFTKDLVHFMILRSGGESRPDSAESAASEGKSAVQKAVAGGATQTSPSLPVGAKPGC
jgi:NADH dehydrogenase